MPPRQKASPDSVIPPSTPAGDPGLSQAREALDPLSRALANEAERLSEARSQADPSQESTANLATLRANMTRSRVELGDLFDKLGPLLRARLAGRLGFCLDVPSESFFLKVDTARMTQFVLVLAEEVAARYAHGQLAIILRGPLGLNDSGPPHGGEIRFRLSEPAPGAEVLSPGVRKDLEHRAYALGGRLFLSPDGTAITLRFAPDAPASTTSQPIVGSVDTRTVLVVDDDELVLSMTERLLRHQGYRVWTARDGEQAGRFFLANRDEIDLVLLDLHMPSKHGGQVLMEITQMKPGQKVVVVSGYSLDSATSDLLTRRGISFLGKPYSPEELLRIIAATMSTEAR